MTKEIPLTRGMVALVDDEDYERVSEFKWCAQLRNGNFYAVRTERGKNIQMHRFLTGFISFLVVDHKNGNTLDNTRKNLRVCTSNQNKLNSKKRKDSAMKYKGIKFHKKGIKIYQAAIKMNGVTKSLGYYATPEEAARAYDAKARELFGEFARCNFED